jgi:hypothetical protein
MISLNRKATSTSDGKTKRLLVANQWLLREAVGRAIGGYGPILDFGAVPKSIVIHAFDQLWKLIASSALANSCCGQAEAFLEHHN